MSPLYHLDQEIFRSIHVGLHRAWLDPFMVSITDSGRGEVKFAILGLLCLFVRYRKYAFMVLVAGATSGLLAQLVKHLVYRQRPSNFAFAHPITSYIEALMNQHAPMAGNSFPSGHATSSFAIAVAVAWIVRKTEHAWIGWVVVLWAALVGFSRVYVGVHFLSDVLGGAAIGALVGTLVFLLWKKKNWIPEIQTVSNLPIDRNRS